MSASGGTKAIIAALLANAGIALAKFVGFLVTGSSSMLAEAVHSVADTSNQGLLLLGGKRAQRAATSDHPFGYGRDRYFYSFVVALLLFSLGSVFALYEGIHKLESHEPLTSPLVAVIILVVAIGLESYSFRTAIGESRPLKGKLSWWGFIRQSKSPELPVVLLEDFGALIGLVLALLGVGLAVLTGNPVFDALGTHRDRHPAGRHRRDPHRRDEEPAHRRGRGTAGAAPDRRGDRGGRPRPAGHPHPHPVPRPRGAARGGEDRAGAVHHDRGRRPRDRRRGAACAHRGHGGPADLPRAGPGPFGRSG